MAENIMDKIEWWHIVIVFAIIIVFANQNTTQPQAAFAVPAAFASLAPWLLVVLALLAFLGGKDVMKWLVIGGVLVYLIFSGMGKVALVFGFVYFIIKVIFAKK